METTNNCKFVFPIPKSNVVKLLLPVASNRELSAAMQIPDLVMACLKDFVDLFDW